MAAPEAEIGKMLRARGWTLGAVESATGGLFAHLITGVPGSSDYFKGSVIAYSNEVKTGLAGVNQTTLEQHGAVSAAVAGEMAAGGRKLLGVDICIADTGIAGPGGATAGKPVGLFYLGLADENGVTSREYMFGGDRAENRRLAAAAMLAWLREYLSGGAR
jgi:PncC family amidohydrolase